MPFAIFFPHNTTKPHNFFHSSPLFEQSREQRERTKIRLINHELRSEMKAEKSLDNGIAFPVKPFLKFKMQDHKHLLDFLQDFYFTWIIHEKVCLLIDFRWLVQKEENVFTCSEIGPDGRLRFDSGPHPQTFYKKRMRGRLHAEPYLIVLKKKDIHPT